MNKLLLVGLLAFVSSTGCAVRVAQPDRGHHPPPPGRAVRAMSYDEAADRARAWARSRGFESKVKDADRKGHGVWKVKLDVWRHDAEGKVHLELDAYTREVVRVDDKVKYRNGRQDHRKERPHKASAVRGG